MQVIDFPIMHKNKTKMIVIKDDKDKKKWRGKLHYVKTYIELLEYKDGYCWLKITINKWIRHQIRAHLASVWFPILWDELYNWEKTDRLYLFSVGMKKLDFNIMIW